jgi:hypothetical protein
MVERALDALIGFDTGWVCEEHPGRPWRGASKRADASDCCGVGMPCAQCNPCGGIDEPPVISRSVMLVIDAKKARDTKADGPRGSKSLLVFPDDSDRTAVVGRNRGDAVQIPERAAPSLG